MSRVLVLGAGVSGKAAARLARTLGMAVTIYSEGSATEGVEEGFGVATGQWDHELLTGVDLVVASPGFSERSLPIVESLEWGVPVWSEIEFAARQLTCPLVAVTGTNGKTTVTEATSAMLVASGLDAPAVGNIGLPLSDYVGGDDDLLVVETSSFQLRFTETFHPVAAAVTNVAIDHLDWHGSEYSYRDAKSKVFANQGEEERLVYDADDPGASSLVSSAPSHLYPVSGRRVVDSGGGVLDGKLMVDSMAIDVSETPFSDDVHMVNLAIAAALAAAVGASEEGISRAVTEFRPGSHRRHVVGEWDGVVWIDDSKATNVHAALASIRARPSVILIAGGLAKGQDITAIAREPNVRQVIGIGTAGPEVVDAAGGRGRLAGSMEDAVRIAGEVASAGDTVLLAPACASFDQFDSYGHRGDRFAELARELMRSKKR